MNKLLLFILNIAIFTSLSGCSFLPDKTDNNREISLCDSITEQAQIEADKANYCQTDDDCIIFEEISSWRPQECFTLGHKDADLSALKDLAKQYLTQNCTVGVYDCPFPQPVCRNNVCVDLGDINQATEPVTETDQMTFTLADVAQHDTKENCWTAINNKVYDITAYIALGTHKSVIVDGCGIDTTEIFVKHSDEAKTQLNSYYLGDLK